MLCCEEQAQYYQCGKLAAMIMVSLPLVIALVGSPHHHRLNQLSTANMKTWQTCRLSNDLDPTCAPGQLYTGSWAESSAETSI